MAAAAEERRAKKAAAAKQNGSLDDFISRVHYKVDTDMLSETLSYRVHALQNVDRSLDCCHVLWLILSELSQRIQHPVCAQHHTQPATVESL